MGTGRAVEKIIYKVCRAVAVDGYAAREWIDNNPA